MVHQIVFLLQGYVLVEGCHEGCLGSTVPVQREVVVEEGVAQVEMEDGLVAVIRGVRLVDGEVPIDQGALQDAAAAEVAQPHIHSSDVPGALHHRAGVK